MSENQVIVKHKQPKNEIKVGETLTLMEKIADEKLASLNNFIPILLSIITSILAFLLVYEVDISTDAGKLLFAVAGSLMFFFAVLIDTQFRKSTYKAVVYKSRKPFNPANLQTYCYLSDDDFQRCMREYAGRKLTEMERYRVYYLKQKINEYIRKSRTVDAIYSVIVIGAVILAASLFLMMILGGAELRGIS